MREIFNPNVGEYGYGAEKLQIWKLFTQCYLQNTIHEKFENFVIPVIRYERKSVSKLSCSFNNNCGFNYDCSLNKNCNFNHECSFNIFSKYNKSYMQLFIIF